MTHGRTFSGPAPAQRRDPPRADEGTDLITHENERLVDVPTPDTRAEAARRAGRGETAPAQTDREQALSPREPRPVDGRTGPGIRRD